MLGNVYPFFLNNKNMKSYYLYEITTPSLSPNYIPYLSLKKVGERVRPGKEELMSEDGDILLAVNKKLPEGNFEDISVDLVSEYFKKFEDFPVIDANGLKFPLIEMQEGTNIQRSLIIGLRDSLRWSKYMFIPGHFVDILWTPTTFVKFEIKGDSSDIWIEPVGVYKNTDLEMQNPLDVNLDTLDYPRQKWSRETKKISIFNIDLKILEWKSFDRKELI